jgi:hypothetical protein
MRRFATIAVSVAVLSAAAPAQETATPPQNAATQTRDADAVAALEKMGASLRALKSFAVHADFTQEQVLTSGQKLQFAGTVDVKARRPNGIRVDVNSDRQARTLYYDGKTATLFSPRVGYYATFAAPATIGELLKIAADKYAIDTPLADLFVWGADTDAAAKLQSAFKVGTATINGKVCDQYAMRQPEADWQVWIEQGGQALPCKLVITTTDDPSMPQYTAVYRWTPQQSLAAGTFTFTPPANARKIAIAASTATASSQ